MLEFKNIFFYPETLVKKRPDAKALVKGSAEYNKINGTVECKSQFFAFHIHSGSKCSGNEKDPFADALTHYNPDDCKHPYHAGDLPPLFGNDGYAYMEFLTDRFEVSEIIGKTVIIHSNPDDFTTQPSGNAGMKIACGIIKKV